MALIPGSSTTAQSWSSLISYIAGFILLVLIVIQKGKDYAEEPVPTKKQSPLLYLLLLLFMPFLAIVVEPLSSWIPMPEDIKRIFDTAFKSNFPTFISVVIAAPFAEEWLCRGVILKGLLRHTTPAKAIVWSSVLFGILHLNPWQAIPAFCMALAIGWVFWRTQSIWPCIFMHAVNNGMAFLMMVLFPHLDSNVTLKDLTGSDYNLIYLGGFILCAGTGYLILRLLRKDSNKTKQ
jgi:membrane protease YdiL (CAAX protease family)